MDEKTWCRVVQHVNGLALGSTLEALRRRGVFELLAAGKPLEVKANPAYFEAALRALGSLGWVEEGGLSERGRRALEWIERYRTVPAWLEHLLGRGPRPEPEPSIPDEHPAARQVEGHLQGFGVARGGVYEYPLSYLPLIARAEELLFGDPEALEVEEHLDRARDIRFSGQVFSPALAQPFLSLLLPLFQGEDRPVAIVDTGCGDGAMLETLYRAVGEPVFLVAADFSPVARETAARRLAELPHRVIFGDVGRPDQIVEALRELGIDPERVLHVNKSVIHNRSFQGSAGSGGPWVGPRGEGLSEGEVEADLVGFFERWRGCLGRFGMVAAEPHVVDPKEAARCWDRSLQPCLELTHAYSRQLLVTKEVYRRAAREAGLQRRGGFELGATAQGHTTMTVEHFTG